MLCLLGCSEPCKHIVVGTLCGATEVVLPIVADGGWPVVEGTDQHHPVRLLVDTGAGASVISASLLGVEDGSWVRSDADR